MNGGRGQAQQIYTGHITNVVLRCTGVCTDLATKGGIYAARMQLLFLVELQLDLLAAAP